MTEGISRHESSWEKFVRPATNKPDIRAVSGQHIMLALILCLFSTDFGMLLATRSPANALLNLGVAAMLLANHLSFAFRWSQQTTILLRVLALGVTAVGVIGMCIGFAGFYFGFIR